MRTSGSACRRRVHLTSRDAMYTKEDMAKLERRMMPGGNRQGEAERQAMEAGSIALA